MKKNKETCNGGVDLLEHNNNNCIQNVVASGIV